MSDLHIYLLGDFRLDTGDGRPIAVVQARQQALLTYLLLHRHTPQARRHLAFLLWPDSSEVQALTNLRKTLTHLRQLAPYLAQAIYADHQVLQWRPPFAVTLDVADFETYLTRATAAEQAGDARQALQVWAAAVERYAGPLTPSCYDDWIITERERLHQLCLGALERLVAHHEQHQDLAAASHYAQQLLRLDPLQETMYLHLMRLQALQGDRAAALRTYHTCVTILARELEIEPAPEIQEAYTRLLNLDSRSIVTPPSPSHHAAPRLVGREVEWAQLQRLWRQASQARAHFVCIWGEAGIGKTQLAETFLQWASQQGFTTARTRTYAGEGQLAYAPVIEWLRAEAIKAVQPRLAPVWRREVARLLPELLSEPATLPAPNPMTEPWQRQHFWEALAQALLAAAQPMLLVLDDLQWCDAETLDWLRYLLRVAPKARLLIVGTARPEEIIDAHPLQSFCRHLHSSEQLTELELGPLDRVQTAHLALQVAQQTLPEQAQQQLYRATAGNPLFIVEMVRAGISQESDTPTSLLLYTPTMLPSKVQAVIQSRLVQLSPPARELARLAAVIGQAFTVALCLQASGQDEAVVVRGLDELWQRRIIQERGAHTYDFSHDRIRDVAYTEISPIRQRQLHRCVAQALEVLYADAPDSVSSQLAAHYDQAGAITQAVGYYQRAATVAQCVFAYNETVILLNKLLRLLDLLPVTPKTIEQKLDTLLLLGSVLILVKGYTASEVETTYNLARALCEHVDHVEKRFFVLCGLWGYWKQRCRWQTASTLEETILLLARQTQNAIHLQIAFLGTGAALVHQGKFKAAHEHVQRAAALYDPKRYLVHMFDYRQEPVRAILCRLTEIFWLLGYPDQAQAKMDEALALAHKLAQPFEMLAALDFVLELAHNQRQQQVMQARIEEYRTLVVKYPFPYNVALDMIYRGWLLTQTEEAETGIDLLKQGFEAWNKQGILMYTSYYRIWLIEAYQWANQFEQGLACLDETLALVEEIGEQFWCAELYRLKGEFLVAQGSTAVQVEPWFQNALQIARQQEAKSLELRAATSLARLWQQQGRLVEAHQRLAEIYNWFTEGFDTADLVEAKALLTALTDSIPALPIGQTTLGATRRPLP